MRDDYLLIAISLVRLQREPFLGPDMRMATSAVLRGISRRSSHSFTYSTCLLTSTQLASVNALKDHGFTVVRVPLGSAPGRNGMPDWKDVAVGEAMKRCETRLNEKKEQWGIYNPGLSEAVLYALDK